MAGKMRGGRKQVRMVANDPERGWHQQSEHIADKIGVLPTRRGEGSVESMRMSSRGVGAGGADKILWGEDSVDEMLSMRRAGDEEH